MADPLDSLKLQVDGVTLVGVGATDCVVPEVAKRLKGDAAGEWSAMSVPLDSANEHWAVFLNDGHTVERQRVTVLEEFWHILLGHKLTKIARIAEAYGRTYDKAEEHDAYYLTAGRLPAGPRRATNGPSDLPQKQTSARGAQQLLRTRR